MLRASLADSDGAPRVAIVGIGNELRCDDAAGSLVARGLHDLQLPDDGSRLPVYHTLVIDAGQAPENITGGLRLFKPNLLLFIDAAEMGKAPGAIRWIAMDEIDGMSASTHRMPISMLASYLSLDLGCDILLLGIQPSSVEMGEGLSTPVRLAVDLITAELSDLLMLQSVTPAPV
jgi:hydrogenase 3 maturation protease